MERVAENAAATDRSHSFELRLARRPTPGRATRRVSEVGIRFGIPLFASDATLLNPTRVSIEPGRIALLTGPSGSGKSSALAEVERQAGGACVVDRVSFPRDAAIIDGIAPWGEMKEAISWLTACGIGEPRLWLRRFEELSDGERFRAKLARGLALHSRCGGGVPLICDEFCSNLHRRLARAISLNLHKLAARRRLNIFLACCNDDVAAELRPQYILRLTGNGRCGVERPSWPRGRRARLLRSLRIERGSRRDYGDFAAMHYRSGDELGFVDKVFRVRQRAGSDTLGIVVYCHSPLNLRLRNEATAGRFCGDARRLNRELRILRRLVVHPDVRGCGVGHYLVRRTLPLVGTPFVECLAGMGEFNPVFEKAGMTRVGQYEVSRRCRAALDELKSMDVNPNGRDFVLQVCRMPGVRAIVAGVVYRWYRATTGGGEWRVARQSPERLAHTFRSLLGSRPMYYLWKRRDAA